MVSKKWHGLLKVQEEMNELGVELMKLAAFPDGKHPGRKYSLIPSVEDECADVLNAINFFIDRNGLDRHRIERRAAIKRKKFVRWMGEPKARKTKTSKKSSEVKIDASRVGQHVKTSKNAPKERKSCPDDAKKRHLTRE